MYSAYLPIALQMAAAVACGVGLLFAIRWIHRASPVAGGLVAAGVAIRVSGGLLLFWISYLQLPILESHQLGEGFWLLAGDGRTYFLSASAAASQGFDTIDWREPAPGYVWILAAALRLFGDSPLTAVLLNVAAYVTAGGILTALVVFQRTPGAVRAGHVVLAALTFSPLLALSAMQPLKEPLFVAYLVLTVAGAFLIFSVLPSDRAPIVSGRFGIGLFALGAGTLGVSGIRPYVAIFIWAAAAAALALFVRGSGRTGCRVM